MYVLFGFYVKEEILTADHEMTELIKAKVLFCMTVFPCCLSLFMFSSTRTGRRRGIVYKNYSSEVGIFKTIVLAGFDVA